MGQQQSAEKEKASAPRSGTPQAEKDRKVNRRISIQALSPGSRATPVNPSASKDNAVAQTATSQHLEKPQLQQYLQSSSPDSSPKDSRVVRSSSKATKPKHDLDIRSKPQQVSEPMNVPVSRSKQDEFDSKNSRDARSAYEDRRYTPMSQMRPPRLPLPIADVAIPDSPTLMPVDKGNSDVPIFEADEPVSTSQHDSHLRRKSSMLSTTTLDDEEEVGEELQPYAVEGNGQVVPTVLEWNGGGNKVYVTGTFANWERKFRLHHRKNSPGMYTTISLPPGTHHLLFVVDGAMTISDALPTAVDFYNVLVNYIEVAYDVDPKARRESTNVGSTAIPYAGQSPTPIETEPEDDSGEVTPDLTEVDEPFIEEIAMGDFRQIIPQALLDIDLPEDDPRYQQAARIISDGPGPPTLPLFLGRTILNGLLPVKDDSSVLTLPNHTVLNHLMTSSVKNGVLSTSVTTRYKKKYVTTISYKPVPKFERADQ